MAYRVTINLEEKAKQKTNEQTQNTELLPSGIDSKISSTLGVN